MKRAKMTEIGAVEAETQFASLLNRAGHGEEFTILSGGEPVAKLVPVRAVHHDAGEARETLARMRERIRRHPDIRSSADEIKKWIAEGRR